MVGDDNAPIQLVDGRVMGGRRPRRTNGGNPGDVTPRPYWRVAGGAFGMLAEEDTPPGYGDCQHKPWHRYSRFPCVCGRTLWPRRGQGRGESPSSPRRLAAKARAAQALELRRAGGWTWEAIARRLSYAGKSGAYTAVRRLLEDDGRSVGDPRWRSSAREVLIGLCYRTPQSWLDRAMGVELPPRRERPHDD